MITPVFVLLSIMSLNIWAQSNSYNIQNQILINQNGTDFDFVIMPQKVPIQNKVPPFKVNQTYRNKSSCSKVDLSPKSGPVREQTSGTCYAYSAMELLNYNQPKRYSALHLAEMSGKVIKGSQVPGGKDVLSEVSGFNGGKSEEAIALGLKMGLCPDVYVPSVDPNASNRKNYKKVLAYYKNAKAKGLTGRSIAEACELNSDGFMTALNSVFRGLNAETIAALYDSSKTLSAFTEGLAEAACKGKLEKNVPPGKTIGHIKSTNLEYYEDGKLAGVFEEKREELMNHLNGTLEKNRPVAISFITNGLIKKENSTVSETGDSNLHGFHSSIVVGRKWYDEKRDKYGRVTQPAGCYYLAKNSWGTDWKVPTGSKAQNVTGKPGYFLISERDLLEHTYGATSLE
jgi:hypothetical protein